MKTKIRAASRLLAGEFVVAQAKVVQSPRGVGLHQDVAGSEGSVGLLKGHKPGTAVMSIRIDGKATYLELDEKALEAIGAFIKRV